MVTRTRNWIPAAFFVAGWLGTFVVMIVLDPDSNPFADNPDYARGEEVGLMVVPLAIGGGLLLAGIMFQRWLARREATTPIDLSSRDLP